MQEREPVTRTGTQERRSPTGGGIQGLDPPTLTGHEPEPRVQPDQEPVIPDGPRDAVLWAGIAWFVVAMAGMVPTGILIGRGTTASIGFILGAVLVGGPVFSVLRLWLAPSVSAALNSAAYSFLLAGLTFAGWMSFRRFEPLALAVAAVLAVPGVLSLLAAREIAESDRLVRRTSRPTRPSALGNAWAIGAVVTVAVVLFVLMSVAMPTFREPIGP